jgi:hypothetical protein
MQPGFYDVQKLMVQEKGEDRYYELRAKKLKKFKLHIDD